MTYTITVSAGTGGAAYVRLDATENVTTINSVSANTPVYLTAVAEEGYEFDGWYEGSSEISDLAEYSFKITKSLQLQARFKIKSYKITVESEDVVKGVVSGGGTCNHGDVVTLKATPAPGYAFDGWWTDPSGGVKV